MKTKCMALVFALFAGFISFADRVTTCDRTWKYTTSGTAVSITGVTPETGILEIPNGVFIGDDTYAVSADEGDVERNPDDPPGMLVKVSGFKRATTPHTEYGESVGTLPVKTVRGLWYQVS